MGMPTARTLKGRFLVTRGSPSFCNFGCGNFILLKLLLLTSKKIKGITTILVHPFRLEESW